jgi:hypothetical protein
VVELTLDSITEYDFIIALDASGSMAEPSTRFDGKSKWEEAQETITGLAHALNKYDTDGIDVVVFGATVDVYEGVTPEKVADIFHTRSPRGSTPLAHALEEVIKLHNHGKKAVCLCFTDGAPDSQDAVVKLITDTANMQNHDEDFTILFVQIGKDAGAAKFLAHLDDNLNAKFDIVDTLSAEEAEQMEPLALINHAIND